MPLTDFRLALTILNLLGSTLSVIGSSFIAICYLILPMKWHFRHALIVNLAMSDLMNSAATTISGMYILAKRHDLSPGIPCTVNGFFTQLSVQGTDCCILAITLVTFFSITKGSLLGHATDNSRLKVFFICAACWLMPITTSITALALGKYGPVSGNWCWIMDNPRYLRYVLTHAWRFLIIFSCIVLYIYLHFWLKRHFKNIEQYSQPRKCKANNSLSRHSGFLPRTMKTVYKGSSPAEGSNSKRDSAMGRSLEASSDDTVTVFLAAEMPLSSTRHDSMITPQAEGARTEPDYISLSMNPFAHRHSLDDNDEDYSSSELQRSQTQYPENISMSSSKLPEVLPSTDPDLQNLNQSQNRRTPTFSLPPPSPFPDKLDTPSGFGNTTVITSPGTTTQNYNRLSTSSTRLSLKRVNRILLMNAYPAAYILLWIPGLCNRLVEASGNKSKVLQVMQASTQFVGLANAITYGWNERIAAQLRRKFFGA